MSLTELFRDAHSDETLSPAREIFARLAVIDSSTYNANVAYKTEVPEEYTDATPVNAPAKIIMAAVRDEAAHTQLAPPDNQPEVIKTNPAESNVTYPEAFAQPAMAVEPAASVQPVASTFEASATEATVQESPLDIEAIQQLVESAYQTKGDA